MTDCHILSKELEKRKKKTVVYGISMGAAVGIYYSTFSNVERLVLENPFLDLCNVVKDFPIKRIFTFLITEKWPSNKRIEKVNCEITFILSEKDKLIFNENGEDLAELCKNDNVYYIRNAGHSNAFVVSKIYKKILIDGLNCEEELK